MPTSSRRYTVALFDVWWRNGEFAPMRYMMVRRAGRCGHRPLQGAYDHTNRPNAGARCPAHWGECVPCYAAGASPRPTGWNVSARRGDFGVCHRRPGIRPVGRGIPDAPAPHPIRGRQGCRPLRYAYSTVRSGGGTHRSRPTVHVGRPYRVELPATRRMRARRKCFAACPHRGIQSRLTGLRLLRRRAMARASIIWLARNSAWLWL